MKKVLIFPYSNQLGTTIPSITLANLLKKNGYQVEFASRGKYTFIIKEKGYKVHDVPEISYLHYRQYLDKNRLDYYNEHAIRIFVDYEVNLIKELNPDIVVGHNRPSLFISTKLTQKKFVNLTVASLTRYYDQPFYIPENHILNRIMPFIDVNKIVPKQLPQLVFDITMKGFAKGFNKVLDLYNLPKVRSYIDLSEADIVLLTETYGLVKLKNIPENYFFLEQNTDSGFGDKFEWVNFVQEQKSKGKRVIALSMGSSAFESYPIILDKLVEFVLAHKEEYILISNHCGLEKEFLNKENIFVEDYIQPSQLLEIADIVITHGGKNTLNEAMLAGKPVIGIPEQAEQLWNLKYAESLGVAKILSRFKMKVDSSILVKEVIKMLNSQRYKKNLKNFVKEDLVNSDIEDHELSIINAIRALDATN